MTAALSDADLDRALEDRIAQRRRRRLDALGGDAIAWLAVAPLWRRRLADACGFPTGDAALDDWLAAAEAAGACRQADAERAGDAEQRRAELLAATADLLTPAQLERVLESLAALDSPFARAGILAELAPHLPESLREQAADAARDIAAPAERALALAALAAGHPEIVPDAAMAAVSIPRAIPRVGALIRLADAAPAPARATLLEQARTALDDVEGDTARGRLLGELALRLAPGALDADARGLLREAAPEALPELAGALAGVLAPEQRERLLREAATGSPDGRSVAALAREAIASGQAADALTAVESLADDAMRAHVLGDLLAPLARAGDAESLRYAVDRAASAAAAGGDPVRTVEGLAALSQALAAAGCGPDAAAIAARAREAAGGLSGVAPAEAAAALARLADALRGAGDAPAATDAARRAVLTVERVGDPRPACSILLAALGHLPDADRAAAFERARTAAKQVGDGAARVRALAGVVHAGEPARRDELLEDALASVAAHGDRAFWMPDGMRAAALADLELGTGSAHLHETVAEIGRRMLAAEDALGPLPPALRRWASLARDATSVPAIAAAADAHIRGAVERADVPEALAWIGTAEMLARVLHGELEAVVRLGNRRVELIYRRIQDARHLERFLERREQVEAFDRLLAGDDGARALHYVGMGGVGKTMLIRHLSRLAAARGVASSRVDFDYLNPEFPAVRPAQLLLDFMEELQAYAATTKEEAVARSFQAAVVRLHEGLSSGAAGDPLSGLESEDFNAALTDFCDFLRLLGRPVVLMLDTCEELAKVQPLGTRLPSIEATFAILERVLERVPETRVVFAGRRPLAQSGLAGWSLAQADRSGGGALLPEHKPYLLLHELRGFTAAEADAFLAGLNGLDLDPAVREAVLTASPDTGTTADYEWLPPRAGRDEPRYNPFDLQLHADWLREVPALAPESIVSGRTDLYVERRILGRIGAPDLLALIPAAVVLGRFDRDLIRPALETDDGAFAEAFRDLAGQEWIEFQLDRATGAVFLAVDRNLLGRLRDFYDREERRGARDAARAALAAGVGELVAGRSLPELAFEHVDAALGLLPAAAASALWDGVVLRATDAGAWGWARRVTERLLGPDGSVGPEHRVRAAVLALHAAALVHEQPTADLAAQWEEVETAAAREPDAEIAAWLTARAAAGRVRCGADADGVLDGQVAGARALQLAASRCAALDALLDRAEAAGEPPGLDVAAWAAGLAGAPAELSGYALALAGRARALAGDPAGARGAYAAARGTLENAPAGHWLDWVQPASVRDRAALYTLRDGAADGDEEWSRSLREARADERIETVDRERLASALLLGQLAGVPVPGADLEALAAVDVYDPQRRPACRAHELVPSLAVALARGWVGLGDGRHALAVLGERLAAATRSGVDERTVHEVQRAQLQVVRRFRDPDAAPGLSERLARSDDPRDVAAALAVLALTRTAPPLPPELPADPVLLHAHWSGQAVHSAGDRRELAERLRGSAASTPATRLDLVEARRLEDLQGDGDEPWPDGDLTPEDALRLRLRAHAIDGEGVPSRADDEGTRVRAELALEEGELLALRLPAAGARLLLIAEGSFAESYDPAGRFIAATARLIALIRAGDGEARSQLGAEVHSAYDALSGAVSGLPSWRRLVSIAEHPTAEAMNGLAPVEWRGWLQRLINAMTWLKNPDLVLRPDALGAVLGRPIPTEARLPTRVRRTTGRVRRFGRGLWTACKALLAVATLIFVPLVIVATLVEAKNDPTIAPDERIYVVIVAALILLLPVAPFLGVYILRRLRRRLASRAPVAISVEREDLRAVGDHGWPPPVRVSMRLQQDRWEPRLLRPDRRRLPRPGPRLRRRLDVRAPTSTPQLDGYAAAAGSLPSTVVDELVGLRKLVAQRPISLRLGVDPSVAGMPWEALLGVALGAERDPELIGRLRIVRGDDAGGARVAATDAGVTIVASATWLPFAEHVWAGRSRALHPRATLPAAGEAGKVLHVIGTAVRTAEGMLLAIEDGAAEHGLEGRSGTLLRPAAVAATGAPVVLIQGEPIEGAGRTDAERRQCAELRLFAASVFEAGARTVLMLPALPPALAGSSAALTAAAFGDAVAGGAKAVSSAVAEARAAIAASDIPDAADRFELALDPTVFMR